MMASKQATHRISASLMVVHLQTTVCHDESTINSIFMQVVINSIFVQVVINSIFVQVVINSIFMQVVSIAHC
jgi:hypothetical protein